MLYYFYIRKLKKYNNYFLSHGFSVFYCIRSNGEYQVEDYGVRCPINNYKDWFVVE